MNSLDDLELELRKLPGVKAAGFDEREDMLLVQLHLGDRIDAPDQIFGIHHGQSSAISPQQSTFSRRLLRAES